ncbi:subtilisin-like protease SBT2.4 [Cucurbita moschata]|uniref:Subtilisin-like protease SBT2.4 n=1 Tax=Cucurbita moschata TaxID=3662 RepID=A0A6J1GUB5_CUCMO|nr:subtilisin-like protease SBT2.4 [Cucurbita moschata]
MSIFFTLTLLLFLYINMYRKTVKGSHRMMEFRSILIASLVLVYCFAEERQIYLVLMEESSNEDHLLQNTLKSYTKLQSFKHIMNGFAVHTTPSEAAKLRQANGVKLVERDRGVRKMTTYTPKFLGVPSKSRVCSKKTKTSPDGEGIVIGFVDSGIDPTHPSFGFDDGYEDLRLFCEKGRFFPLSSCNGKIVGARFFSEGARAVAKLNSSVDFLSPFDAEGHGSHVASIAAGNGGVPVYVNGFFYGFASGMAPRARIAVYKAVYPTMSTLTDVVSAIDQAVIDGVDILALSVGPNEPPEEGLTFLSIYDIAILSATRAGILVVQAVGNNGPAPATVVSYSPWSVGVAASGTDRVYPASLLLGNGQKVGGVGLSGPTFFLHKLVLAKDAMNQNGTMPSEECQYPEAFDPNLVQNSIVLCSFSQGFLNGTSSLAAIIHTATTLRFIGFALIANPNYGDFIAEPIPFGLPGILIPNASDSQAILKYYEANTCKDDNGMVSEFKGKAAIGEGRVASFGSQAPTVSRFSSRGPDYMNMNRTVADVLKPDILAPGHQIWAAWSPLSVTEPLLKGYQFALMSGTSMAAPHIVGIAALIKQKNPSWTPSMIASAMSTTATKYDMNGDLIQAEGFNIHRLYPSTPFDLGAGLVKPTNALDPGLVFPAEYEDYINFLCSLPGDPAVIKNTTGGQCNASEPQPHPADLNLPSVTISSLVGHQVLHRRVKNVGTKVETYVWSVIPPNGTTININPPWFTIAPGGLQNLEIQIKVTQKMNHFTFGEIIFTGSLNHIGRIPLSVLAVSVS